MRPTNGPAGHQDNGAQASQSNNSHIAVTFVGHATTYIEMDGQMLATDPLLRDRLWHLRRDAPCDAPGCLPDGALSAVMISHLHLDHADVPSLRRIPPDVPLIAPRGTERYLRARLPHPVCGVDAWESCRVGTVEVVAVPAAHTGLGPAISPLAACAGFIVRGSATIYFAGDTALFGEMAELGDRFDIDLALLPVWGYGPSLRGNHLTPRDAAHALTLLRPRRAIPIHWGTFRPLGKLWRRLHYLSDPPYTFAGYAAQMAPATEVHILQPGETLAF